MDTIFITKFEEKSCDILLKPNRKVKRENLGDRCKYFLTIGCGLRVSKNLPLFIETDDGNIPLLDKFGDIVYANQLSTRKRYCIGYGNNNNSYNVGQFIVYNNLCLASPSSQNNTKAIKEVAK